MDKSPDAFRTISEVADALDTPAHVLRFWETRFPQIRPVKRAGGRRYYRPTDVALLTGIKRLLHDDGLTIRGVQKILRQQGVRHVAALGGDDGIYRSRLDDPLDIMDDIAQDDGVEQASIVSLSRDTASDQDPQTRNGAAAIDTADLWPDADLPPPDDDGAVVLHLRDPEAVDDGMRLSSAPPDDAELVARLVEASDPAPETAAAALAPGEPAGRPVAETDDVLIGSVLEAAGIAAPIAPSPPPRGDDGWRSLPLAMGEEMPMATRLRALPQGALAPRAAEVAAWVLRARALTDRMNPSARGGG